MESGSPNALSVSSLRRHYRMPRMVHFFARICSSDRQPIENVARGSRMCRIPFGSMSHAGVCEAFRSVLGHSARHRGFDLVVSRSGRGCTITDDGLAVLADMPQLETLILSDSKVTYAGVECLSGLTKLKWIYLDGTGVTLEAVKRLKQHLPDTRIMYVFGELTL